MCMLVARELTLYLHSAALVLLACSAASTLDSLA